jgi:hypothetical protein
MPVALGQAGRFSQPGKITNQGGGPSAADRPVSVTFEGTLTGARLARVIGKGSSAETHHLVHGTRSKVILCL